MTEKAHWHLWELNLWVNGYHVPENLTPARTEYFCWIKRRKYAVYQFTSQLNYSHIYNLGLHVNTYTLPH